MHRFRKKRYLILALIILIPFLFAQKRIMPVQGATSNDWNKDTFWYEPWGASGVHKGVDIFAKKNTPVIAATSGVVLYSGERDRGGNIVLMLGPQWRLHYYAHLEKNTVQRGQFVHQSDTIGTVGATGNAVGKPPHLHYSVLTLIPMPWRITTGTQGILKMFYLHPLD